MSPWLGVLACVAGGAVLGAIGLSLFPILILQAVHLYYILRRREFFGDGQLALVLLVTVLFGGLVGGVVGAVAALLRLGHPGIAGWVSIVGGGIVGALATFFAWGSANSRGGDPKDFLITLVNPVSGAPFLWAVGLVVWGSRLLGR
jgi:hypothetical protein